MDKSFFFFEKDLENMVSGTCRFYVSKRYKCAENNVKRGCAYAYPPLPFGFIFDQKSIKSLLTNSSQKRSPKNIEFDTKGVPTWSQNQYQKSSKINAQTGNEKDYKNIKNHGSLNGKIIEIHCKSTFFLWLRRLHVRTVKISKKHQK